jgi:hypothetical protein
MFPHRASVRRAVPRGRANRNQAPAPGDLPTPANHSISWLDELRTHRMRSGSSDPAPRATTARSVDALNNAMMFARPVAMHQGNLAGIVFVQRGIVNDQQPARAVDKQLGLLPEPRRIWLKPLKKSVHGIMRGPMRRVRLHTGGFATRDHVRCGDQEIDVIEISHFGHIHARMIANNPSTAQVLYISTPCGTLRLYGSFSCYSDRKLVWVLPQVA